MNATVLQFGEYLEQHPWAVGVLIAAAVWSVPWKGAALWRAARRGEFGWFVALLVVNTVGILEILYLFVFSKRRDAGGVAA